MIIASANFTLLALVDISFRVVEPVFFSTPIPLGGLGLDPPMIGTIMSLTGILNGVFTVFLFARMTDWFGVKWLYLTGMIAAVPCFVLFPVINYLARNSVEHTGGLGPEVWIAVGVQVIMTVLLCMGYGASSSKLNHPRTCPPHPSVPGAIFIFIAAAAPNKASLGATNGIAQLSVAIVRAVGPALASSMYSLSIDKEHHYMNGGLVYYVTTALSLCAVWMGSLLPKHPWKDRN